MPDAMASSRARPTRRRGQRTEDRGQRTEDRGGSVVSQGGSGEDKDKRKLEQTHVKEQTVR